MNDPFEVHEVNHLSPSSINQFIMNPCKWIMAVAGYKDPHGGPAMWRGIAVDKAVERAITDLSQPHADVITYAKSEFSSMNSKAKSNGFVASEKKLDLEERKLESFTDAAVTFYRKFGTPEDTQTKIKIELEFLPVPIIGYADFVYKETVRDLKTVSQMPSEIPDSHRRQLATYAFALKKMPCVDYVQVTVSGKQQVRPLRVTDAEHHFEIVKKTARNMMNLLSISTSIEEIANLMMPDLDHWSFSSPEERAFARKLWDIPRNK